MRELHFVDGLKCRDGGGADWLVEAREHRAARGGDAAVDAAFVGVAALPADELLLFQALEQAGDAGRLLDHALGDLQNGKAALPRAAQDAEDVELLGRDSLGLD